MTPLESLVACGTKLWLDSIDPDEVQRNRAGATGATSNPIIIADLIKTGRFDDLMAERHPRRPERRRPRLAPDRPARPPGPGGLPAGLARDQAATTATSASSWTRCWKTPTRHCRRRERTARYIELGKKWSTGPQEPHDQGAGDARRPGARSRNWRRPGVTLNVTLDLLRAPIQHRPRRHLARGPAACRARRLQVGLQHLRQPRRRLHREARPAPVAGGPGPGRHRQRQAHLAAEPDSGPTKSCRCKQEMIFASTGTKKPRRLAVEVRRGLRRLATSRPTRRRPTRGAGQRAHFTRHVDELPRRTCSTRSQRRSTWPSWKRC